MFGIPLMNHWMWLSVAAILAIADVVLGTSFFLLWLGVIAAFVGIITWTFPSLAPEFQLLIFALGSILSLIAWRNYLKKHPRRSAMPTLNRRAEQYVGRIFTLAEPIVNGRGKIRVDDSTWRVEGVDMPVNTRVKVVGVDGIILKVEREP